MGEQRESDADNTYGNERTSSPSSSETPCGLRLRVPALWRAPTLANDCGVLYIMRTRRATLRLGLVILPRLLGDGVHRRVRGLSSRIVLMHAARNG